MSSELDKMFINMFFKETKHFMVLQVVFSTILLDFSSSCIQIFMLSPQNMLLHFLFKVFIYSKTILLFASLGLKRMLKKSQKVSKKKTWPKFFISRPPLN